MRVLMAERSDIYCDARVQKEAWSLANDGYDVSVLGLRSTWRPRNLDINYRLLTFPLVSRRFRLIRNVHLALLIALINMLIIFRRADFYHAHNTMFLFGMWISARLHRGILIYDSHEVQWELDRVSEELERKLIRKAAAIINVSQGRAEAQSERHNYPPERITVVANYPPLPKNSIESTQMVPDKIRFIYSGGFNLTDNRLDNFVEALVDFPQMEFSLMSFGYGDSFERLSEKIRVLKLEASVGFLPLVNPDQVLGVIAKYDFAVNLLTNPNDWVSYKYPAINKIYEYLAAGLPILCSTLPAFEQELVATGVGVAVDASNVSSIKNGLRHILDNRDSIPAMKAKARQLAEEKYNWQSQERKLLNLYQQLGRERRLAPASSATMPFSNQLIAEPPISRKEQADRS